MWPLSPAMTPATSHNASRSRYIMDGQAREDAIRPVQVPLPVLAHSAATPRVFGPRGLCRCYQECAATALDVTIDLRHLCGKERLHGRRYAENWSLTPHAAATLVRPCPTGDGAWPAKEQDNATRSSLGSLSSADIAALGRCHVTQCFHEQTRVGTHAPPPAASQLGRNVFRRIEIVTRLVGFDGHGASPVCTPAISFLRRQ